MAAQIHTLQGQLLYHRLRPNQAASPDAPFEVVLGETPESVDVETAFANQHIANLEFLVQVGAAGSEVYHQVWRDQR